MKKRKAGGLQGRDFRAKSCTGKKKYRSRAEAADMIAVQVSYGKDMAGVYPYRCGFCNKWHLGHSMTDADAE